MGFKLRDILPTRPHQGPPVPQVATNVVRLVAEIDEGKGELPPERIMELGDKYHIPLTREQAYVVGHIVKSGFTPLGVERSILQMWGMLPKPIEQLERWRKRHKPLLERISEALWPPEE